jgi:hypothetical protein
MLAVDVVVLQARSLPLAWRRKPLGGGNWEAQRRFLRQFGDAEQWIAYMDPDSDSGSSAAAPPNSHMQP